ncbi:MAG: hypothetical protein JXX14_09545 [Deltaproteobacteria bacterium]|nr:hypothetical protein [Deltaproteobacteria bacterium]
MLPLAFAFIKILQSYYAFFFVVLQPFYLRKNITFDTNASLTRQQQGQKQQQDKKQGQKPGQKPGQMFSLFGYKSPRKQGKSCPVTILFSTFNMIMVRNTGFPSKAWSSSWSCVSDV